MSALRLTATVALGLIAPSAFAQSSFAVARVQRLEDIEEIRTVLISYGRYLDARDFKSYSQLFAKDGEWVGGLGTVKGPEAIQAFMEKNIPGPNRANNYHIL